MASHRRNPTWSPGLSETITDDRTNNNYMSRNHRRSANASHLSTAVNTVMKARPIASPPRHHHLHYSNLVGSAASANKDQMVGSSSLPYNPRFPNRAAFEADCEKRGLCPRCGQTRTHKIRKTFMRLIAEPLTVADEQGDFVVYKGYHIGPMCYTVNTAKQILEQLESRGRTGGAGIGGLLHRNLREIEAEDMRRSKQAPAQLQSSDDRLHFDPTTDPTILDYTGQKLSPSDVQAIIHYKLIEDGQVKTLLLDHCELGDDGIRALVNALLQVKPPELKILCLRKNKIGKDGARELARLFQQTESPFKLEEVRLSHNKIGDDGTTLIFRALQYVEDSSLKSISLSYNNITQKGASVIGAALAENDVLESVRLDHNRIRDVGLQDICAGVGRNATSRLSEMSLRDNVVSNVGAEALATLLTRHKKCLRIIVGRNEIGLDGARAIYKAMACRGSFAGSIVLGLEDKNLVTDQALLAQVAALVRDRQSHHDPNDPTGGNDEDNRSHDALGAPAEVLAPTYRDVPEIIDAIANSNHEIPPASQSPQTQDQQAVYPPQQQKKTPEHQCYHQDQHQTVIRIDSALARELTQSLDINDIEAFLRTQQEALPQTSSHHETVVPPSHHDPLALSFHEDPQCGSLTPPTASSTDHDNSKPSPSLALQNSDPNLYAELREAFPDIEDLDAFLEEQVLFQGGTASDGNSIVDTSTQSLPVDVPSRNSLDRNNNNAPTPEATVATCHPSLAEGLDASLIAQLQQIFPDVRDLEKFLREQQDAAQHIEEGTFVGRS